MYPMAWWPAKFSFNYQRFQGWIFTKFLGFQGLLFKFPSRYYYLTLSESKQSQQISCENYQTMLCSKVFIHTKNDQNCMSRQMTWMTAPFEIFYQTIEILNLKHKDIFFKITIRLLNILKWTNKQTYVIYT